MLCKFNIGFFDDSLGESTSSANDTRSESNIILIPYENVHYDCDGDDDDDYC